MKRTPALFVTATALAAVAMMLAAPAPSGAVASGANGRVLFVSNRDGDKEIYAMRSDGTGLVQLTNNTANDWDPNVSADGTKVVFVSDRLGKVELFTMNIDGSIQKRVTNNNYIDSHPSWNPLGRSFVWAAQDGADSDIWKAFSNGTGATDLTPDPDAYDANPAWSPGGIKIAFDRTVGSSTNLFTMENNGTAIEQLTTTNTDSNPSYAPDNKTIAFETTRDNGVPGPQDFATLQQPGGVAVTSTRVLATQFNSDKVKQIDSSGTVSNFATLPTTGLNIERYLAVSPGLGGFPKDYVYVTVGQNVYKVSPDGLTVTLWLNIPALPNGETGITFDTVGTFFNRMILTDRRGPVYAVDANGTYTQIGDVGAQIEGPLVVPLSFASPFGGQILMGNEFQDKIFTLAPCAPEPCNGVVSSIPDPGTLLESPEAAIQIPSTVCNMGTSGGAYFIAYVDENLIRKFDASNFTGMSGDLLAPSELSTEINRVHSDGTNITISEFWPGTGTPDLEGSAFAPCGAGAPARTTQALAGNGPHEIYTINVNTKIQTRLTNNAFDDINPGFSPDGLTVAFATDRDDPNFPTCEGTGSCKYEVYTMTSTGGSQTNITHNTNANDVTPDWQSVSGVIDVGDNFFDPANTKPKLGVGIMWDITGDNGHTITDNSGMDLFGTDILPEGQFYVFRFNGAGSYPYICTVHPTEMTGNLNVPMSALPKTGNLTTVFTVTWAAAPIAGYKFDAQIQRPGGVFEDWKMNTGALGSTFTADAGAGTYRFQARVRNTLNGFSSNYSQPVSITVNP